MYEEKKPKFKTSELKRLFQGCKIACAENETEIKKIHTDWSHRYT